MSDLLARLQRMRGDHLGDGFTNVRVSELLALVDALQEIAEPIKYWQEHIGPDEKLDGLMLVHLANDPETYRRIARYALAGERK